MTSKLFTPLKLRGLTLRHRIFLPPMCQYSVHNQDGIPTNWHTVHYGALAAGGFSLLIAEATAVTPEGRISPNCTGLWNDEQRDKWKPIVDFCHAHGAAIGIQLAHAGRKASTYPMLPNTPSGSVPPSDGGWTTCAPTAEAFPGLAQPQEMTTDDIHATVRAFGDAARRAVEAGFDTVQIHAAHGYLIHQYLSPVSNKRSDAYGGTPDNRARFLTEIIREVRAAMPDTMPLMLRISATDWLPEQESWTVDSSIDLINAVKDLGVDIVDVSTGGLVPASIPVGPGYQVECARRIKQETHLPVVAVGKIESPELADYLVSFCDIDAIDIGSQALANPHWPAFAAHKLGVDPVEAAGLAGQYMRAVF